MKYIYDKFFSSFLPLLKRIKKYTVEVVIISFALLITFVSLFLYLENNKKNDEEIITPVQDSQILTVNQKKFMLILVVLLINPNLSVKFWFKAQGRDKNCWRYVSLR